MACRRGHGPACALGTAQLVAVVTPSSASTVRTVHADTVHSPGLRGSFSAWLPAPQPYLRLIPAPSGFQKPNPIPSRQCGHPVLPGTPPDPGQAHGRERAHPTCFLLSEATVLPCLLSQRLKTALFYFIHFSGLQPVLLSHFFVVRGGRPKSPYKYRITDTNSLLVCEPKEG